MCVTHFAKKMGISLLLSALVWGAAAAATFFGRSVDASKAVVGSPGEVDDGGNMTPVSSATAEEGPVLVSPESTATNGWVHNGYYYVLEEQNRMGELRTHHPVLDSCIVHRSSASQSAAAARGERSSGGAQYLLCRFHENAMTYVPRDNYFGGQLLERGEKSDDVSSAHSSSKRGGGKSRDGPSSSASPTTEEDFMRRALEISESVLGPWNNVAEDGISVAKRNFRQQKVVECLRASMVFLCKVSPNILLVWQFIQFAS